MLEIAVSYDLLAERAEQRDKDKPEQYDTFLHPAKVKALANLPTRRSMISQLPRPSRYRALIEIGSGAPLLSIRIHLVPVTGGDYHLLVGEHLAGGAGDEKRSDTH
jgi:hypothetical protein